MEQKVSLIMPVSVLNVRTKLVYMSLAVATILCFALVWEASDPSLSAAEQEFKTSKESMLKNGFHKLGSNFKEALAGDALIVIDRPNLASETITHVAVVIGVNEQGKLVIRGPFAKGYPVVDLTEDQFRRAYMNHGEQLEVWGKEGVRQRLPLIRQRQPMVK
jgi:hypothetical protein